MLVVPYLLLIYIVLVVVGMMLVLDFWVCSIGIDEAWREKKRTEKRMLLLSLGKVIISELCIVCLTLPFVCLQNGSLFPLVMHCMHLFPLFTQFIPCSLTM